MTEEKAAEVETTPAVIPSTTPNYPEETALTPFEGDFMEITIEVAAHVEKYEKALNMIMNFIIKRTYAGDWVSHDKANTPIEDRTANPSGAAMERVARDLGIQETNRTRPIKQFHGEEHPGHYYYQCEADFEFRGRKIHALGMASTLNPFYYKRDGGNKAPADIREEYIIRDCLRDCVKQGVKGMFGLRKIPVMKLRELGYDISKIKYVNYQSGENSQTTKNAAATAAPAGAEKPPVAALERMVIEIAQLSQQMKSQKGSPFYKVTDTEGATIYLWGNEKSERVKKVWDAFHSDNRTLTVDIKTGQYPEIVAVIS